MQTSCRIMSKLMLNEKVEQLFDAIREGNLALVKDLIVFQRVGVNSRLEYPDSPLVKSIKSALVQAVEYEQLEITKFLVEAGANVNWFDDDYGTPCFIAKSLGFQEVADYLRPLTNSSLQEIAEGKTNVYQPEQESGLIVELLKSIEDEDTSRVQELIEEGADVNTKYEDNLTPLILATRVKNFQIVRILVESGADVNALDADFESALLTAKIMGLKEIESYLEPLTSTEIRAMIEQQISE